LRGGLPPLPAVRLSATKGRFRLDESLICCSLNHSFFSHSILHSAVCLAQTPRCAV
jgi:hypothetical protein